MQIIDISFEILLLTPDSIENDTSWVLPSYWNQFVSTEFVAPGLSSRYGAGDVRVGLEQ